MVENEESKQSDKGKKEVVEAPSEREVSRPSRRMLRDIDDMFEDFRRSFDSLMAPFLPMRTFWKEERLPVRCPLLDLVDEGDHYLVKAELPGFSKDMVDIQVNKDTLVLNAEMKEEEERERDDYLHRERSYSSCRRRVNFPEEVDPSNVEGTMKNGVLTLEVYKKEPKPEEKMRKVDLK